MLFPDTSDEHRCESAHLGFRGATFDLTSPVAFAADPPPRFRTRPQTIHHAQSKTHRIPYAVNSDFNHKPPHVTGRVVRGAPPESSTLARSANVPRRYSTAQGSSGIMVCIVIELFLKNTLEFTDSRTTGARWRGRGYFWTSRYNQKCNLASGGSVPTSS